MGSSVALKYPNSFPQNTKERRHRERVTPGLALIRDVTILRKFLNNRDRVVKASSEGLIELAEPG